MTSKVSYTMNMRERLNIMKEEYFQEISEEIRDIASIDEESQQVMIKNMQLEQTVKHELEKPNSTLLPYPPPLVPINPSLVTCRVEPMLPP